MKKNGNFIRISYPGADLRIRICIKMKRIRNNLVKYLYIIIPTYDLIVHTGTLYIPIKTII